MNLERKKILVDIDNTIANIMHRLKYIINKNGTQKEKKDWVNFLKDENIYKDEIRMEVALLLKEFKDDSLYEVFYVTGRNESTRIMTEKWIKLHRQWLPEGTLLMRPNQDRRDDNILKKELTEKMINVTHIFEDRPRVIKMYRELFPESIIIDTGNLKHFPEERL